MINVSLPPPMRLFQLRVHSESCPPAQPPASIAQDHFAASNALRLPAVISFSPARWDCSIWDVDKKTYLLRGHQVGNCDRKGFSWRRQWLQQVRRRKVSFKYPLDQDRLQLSITGSNKIETNLGVTSGSKELPKKVYNNKHIVFIINNKHKCVLDEKTRHGKVQIQIFSAPQHCPVYLLLEPCILQFEFYMSLLHVVHHKIKPGALNYTFRRIDSTQLSKIIGHEESSHYLFYLKHDA